jgi:endoglucanase
MRMNKRLSTLTIAIACLLMVPAAAFAQLPAPTYGWNLGNTMEPPGAEGAWNNPPVTQEVINAVAAAGFNTIRLPVAWDSHANQTTYQIDPAWLARVKQVVDWSLARNLTVVLNSHWDNGWLDENIGNSVNATINAKVRAYWTQIANTFAGYDSRLLFACTNEPSVDTASEMSTLLAYEQTFINAVRGTGGNNSTRWLIIQGPSTDIDLTDQLMNTLPNDPTPGRLVVEVHYYTPYQYTLMTGRDQWWGDKFYFWGAGYHTLNPDLQNRNANWGEEADMDALFQKMSAKFVSNGIPVLVGEFGAIQRTEYPELTGADLNLHLASRTYFHKTVVDKANSKGLRPVYWDNGWAANDGFALIDRNTAAVIDPDNVSALTGGPALPPPAPPPGATCRAPAYSPTATYCKGDIVSYNLRDWMWENKRGKGACGGNDAPGGAADPWKDLGVCAK